MTTDALDPGEDGSYPWWPRLPDGTTNPERMPRGPRQVHIRVFATQQPFSATRVLVIFGSPVSRASVSRALRHGAGDAL